METESSDLRQLVWPYVKDFLDKDEFMHTPLEDVLEMLSVEDQVAIIESAQKEADSLDEQKIATFSHLLVHSSNRTLARMCQVSRAMRKRCVDIVRFVCDTRHGTGTWGKFAARLSPDIRVEENPVLGLAVLEVGLELTRGKVERATLKLGSNATNETVMQFELGKRTQELNGLSQYVEMAVKLLEPLHGSKLDVKGIRSQYIFKELELETFVSRFQMALFTLLGKKSLHMKEFRIGRERVYLLPREGRAPHQHRETEFTDYRHLISMHKMCQYCPAAATGACRMNTYCSQECHARDKAPCH